MYIVFIIYQARNPKLLKLYRGVIHYLPSCLSKSWCDEIGKIEPRDLQNGRENPVDFKKIIGMKTDRSSFIKKDEKAYGKKS